MKHKLIESEKTGLPIELTKFLRDKLNINTFVETGTGLGRTAKIASELFDFVYTIEADKERWHYNIDQFKNINGAVCLFGESPQKLKDLLNSFEKVFPDEIMCIFLDAHCSYREQVTNVACPVLEEIKIIPNRHVIIIDDAHSFLNVHKVKKVMGIWPELTDVILALKERNNPYIIVDGKSIVTIPRELKSEVQEFMWRKNNA